MSEKIDVPISTKQRQMVLDTTQALQAAQQQQSAVLNALAAGVDFEGALTFVGLETREDKHYLVLAKPDIEPPAPPA